MTNIIKTFSCLLALTLGACGATSHKKERVRAFPVIKPLMLDTVYEKEYAAEIDSKQNIELRARVKGYLEHIYVDEGAEVEAGQLLFSISSQEYREELLKTQAMLKSAVANAKAAELDIENARLLSEKGIISKTELAKANARLEALNAKTEEIRSAEANARLRLSYAEVRAPFKGMIDRLPSKAGSLVDEGTLLTTLSDNSEVYAYFNVSENEYLAYIKSKQETSERNKVILILADNTQHSYYGMIETIEGEFNPGTGSIAFRARFPNPDHVLRHGATGKVRVKRHLKDVLVIPQKATFEIQDKMYVFVLGSDNVVRMRSVVPRMRLPQLYVLNSGLTLSDAIVYEGIQEMRDSMKINPTYLNFKSILPQLGKP